MINISDACAGYGKNIILNNTSLEIKKGKITTLIGPNGCGKSTLLKTIIGLLPLYKGDISIDGESIKTFSNKLRAQKIAYLSQGKNIPDITVERMVLHGRFPYLAYPRRYRKCDFDEAKLSMEKMGITELATKKLSELSGGMRQKVYIAMALCQGADVILFDEPATYLDVSHQIKLYEMCRELADEGKTIFMITHDIISALKLSDIIAVMNDGKILKVSTAEDIVNSNIVADVFGVRVVPINYNGHTEYCYDK